MFDGFVFYRIDVDRRDNAIGKIIQGAITVDVGLTEAALAVADLAAPQTEVTTGGAVIDLLLQAGLHQLVLVGGFSG